MGLRSSLLIVAVTGVKRATKPKRAETDCTGAKQFLILHGFGNEPLSRLRCSTRHMGSAGRNMRGAARHVRVTRGHVRNTRSCGGRGDACRRSSRRSPFSRVIRFKILPARTGGCKSGGV